MVLLPSQKNLGTKQQNLCKEKIGISVLNGHCGARGGLGGKGVAPFTSQDILHERT